jgi:preprotein translocase subunit SecG
MGVKQTTDVLEKGTWLFAAVVAVLCIVSPAFIPKDGKGGSKNSTIINDLSTKPAQAAPATAPTTTAPMPGTATPDSPKK